MCAPGMSWLTKLQHKQAQIKPGRMQNTLRSTPTAQVQRVQRVKCVSACLILGVYCFSTQPVVYNPCGLSCGKQYMRSKLSIKRFIETAYVQVTASAQSTIVSPRSLHDR